MREFRGKRTDNDEWIYGDLIHYKSTVGDIDKVFIATGGEYSPDMGLRVCGLKEVIPETVGQYIGWDDINDRNVYEKDIVKAKDPYNERQFIGKVKFQDASFCIVNDCSSNYCWTDYEVEVLGNEWDNPELLEV